MAVGESATVGGGGAEVSLGVVTEARAFGTKTGALTLTRRGEVMGAGDAEGLDIN